MIEIRLRAAASNPSSRKWSLALAVVVLVFATVAPVATSRAQDASRQSLSDLETLRALKGVTIEGGRTISIDAGDAISITSGAASITMRRDGTIVLKGTDIVIDGAKKSPARGSDTSAPSSLRAAQMSEIF